MMTSGFWSLMGSLGMFLTVGLGAFAAHALRGRLSPEFAAAFETGVRYQAYHSLGLFAVAGLLSQGGSGAHRAGWCFIAGIVLFSGSLYALSLTGIRKFGAITPVGGMLFLIGWLLLALAARRGA